MVKTRFILLVLCLLWMCSCHENENTLHSGDIADNKVSEVQAQIKKIYPQLIETVVSIGDGSSGVIVSEDGYVLTASHVVESLLAKSDTILVRLHDGREEEVEKLGRTKSGDYALLKIKKQKKWPYVEIGSNSELSSSEVCVMLSHPEGKQEGRPAVLRIGFVRGHTGSGFLRTSCKMMPGDSGGPLFNLKGELIGINSSCNAKMYENYFASVDSIRAHWKQVTKGEEYAMTAPLWRHRVFNRAPEREAPFVLPGDYYALNNKLKANYSISSQYVFPIYNLDDDDKVIVHATCFSKDGNLVSKSSLLLEDTCRCRLSDGTFRILKVIGRSEENDLVFLSFENYRLDLDLPQSDNVELGDLIAGYCNNQLLASGIISCETRNVAVQQEGAFHQEVEDLRIKIPNNHYKNPAVKLEDGDKIISLNSKEMLQQSDLDKFLSHTCPGQKVEVVVERAGEELEFEIALGPFQMKGHPAYQLKVSGKREGFANAFTCDVPLEPVECGTPLVNLEGKVVGISIARSTRTCTYAIPIAKVIDAYKMLIEKSS